ncbi:MAG TPA: hypothetical protein VGD05_07100 [Pyrinomonadaceae bacterium]
MAYSESIRKAISCAKRVFSVPPTPVKVIRRFCRSRLRISAISFSRPTSGVGGATLCARHAFVEFYRCMRRRRYALVFVFDDFPKSADDDCAV